jgi:DNA polymerase III sliding clamp (beta) subunit (PCNA family)
MIEIDTEIFCERLSFVADGAMSRIGGMYQKVCLERGDSGIFLRSFNQVAHSLARVSDEGGEPFRVLFNPDPLSGALSRVEGTLTIEPKGSYLKVSGPADLEHPCYDGEDFIDFPTPEVDPVELSGGEGLSSAMQQVGNAVDENAPNQRFAGVYVGDRHTGGTVHCVGANTTSLIRVEMAGSSAAEEFQGESILPAQSLGQVRALLEGKEELNLYLGDREASFVAETGAVCTRLVADKYPNYPSIMPDPTECQEVVMGLDGFKTALQVCRQYTEDFGAVLLDFNSKKLVVSAAEAKGGAASFEVSIDTPEMGRMRLKCSADRMMEVVKGMEGREITMLVPLQPQPSRVGVSGENEDVDGAVALMVLQPGEELQE